MSAAHEIRMADVDGRGEVLDEVIARKPRHVHFESMDDDQLWCGIVLSDGEMIHVNVSAVRIRGKAELRWFVEEDWKEGRVFRG